MRTTFRTAFPLVAGVLALLSACETTLDLGGNLHNGTGTGGSGGPETTATGSIGGCAPQTTAPCYDGPAKTEGVGLCKAGIKACTADGMTYGPCVGGVIPKPEDCATPVDEDCDGLAPACKGTPLWSKRTGDAADQYSIGVAADSAGNVLVTGYFAGKMDLGGCPLPLSSAGGTDLFVAKLDPAGACLWSKNSGDANSQFGNSVTVDASGNVLVTGYFYGQMDLGGCPLSSAGGTDLFVAKLDPSGACLWSKSAGDTLNQHGDGVAVDDAGNVVITGGFAGVLDFGGCPLTSAGGNDLFVAKLDPSGACLRSKRAGNAFTQPPGGAAVDSAGNVLVTGGFFGALDFGGCPVSSSGGVDLFVAKLNPSGACLWSKSAGDAVNQYGNGVAVDGAGNVLVTGGFSGALDLGGCPLSSSGGVDLFVSKLDPSGTCLWSKSAGDGKNIQYTGGIAVDNTGNILVVGSYKGPLDFGGGSLVSAGAADIFLVKLDAAGGHVWSRRAGSPSDDTGKGVTVDGSGNVLMTGYFTGTADFSPAPLVSEGGIDIFLAKFGP